MNNEYLDWNAEIGRVIVCIYCGEYKCIYMKTVNGHTLSGIHKILIGRWSDDSAVLLEVISGSMGKDKVHYRAPYANNIESEMEVFIKWINSKQDIDLVIKAAVAHLWFVTLHPFEDGNGRIARGITDMTLSQYIFKQKVDTI